MYLTSMSPIYDMESSLFTKTTFRYIQEKLQIPKVDPETFIATLLNVINSIDNYIILTLVPGCLLSPQNYFGKWFPNIEF